MSHRPLVDLPQALSRTLGIRPPGTSVVFSDGLRVSLRQSRSSLPMTPAATCESGLARMQFVGAGDGGLVLTRVTMSREAGGAGAAASRTV